MTLHVDQLHLFSNVFAGLIVGAAASQLLGPGVAWWAALVCGRPRQSSGDVGFRRQLIRPWAHRRWYLQPWGWSPGWLGRTAWGLRERRWYRWAPLIVGASMLALFGAGGERVDVLGHLLGFLSGTLGGWVLATLHIPRSRAARTQCWFGGTAVVLVGCAWALALKP